MKGFITTALTAVCLGGGLTAAHAGYLADLYDCCWLERYTYMADQEVHAAFGPQAYNGHVLDQTIWNWQFEAGRDVLTPAGMEHLAYLARRRPCPDPKIYLQTAQDIEYDPATPDKFVEARSDLDRKRIVAIEKYLTAQTAGRPVAFVVSVHDPAVPGMSAVPMNIAILQMYTGYRGNLPVTAGAGAVGGAGVGGVGR
jgi:hypothetical protein